MTSTMQMANTTTKCNTDVTVANAQPMVSPGPPLLSPQFQQHLANNAPPPPTTSYAGATGARNSQGANTPMTTSALVRGPPLRPPLATGPRGPVGGMNPMNNSNAPPPVLTPSGLPVTSGAVIRSVLPNIRGKTQFARMPSASGGPCQVSGSPNLMRAMVPGPGALPGAGATGSSTSQATVTKPNSKPIYAAKNPSVSSAPPVNTMGNPVNTTGNPGNTMRNPVNTMGNPMNPTGSTSNSKSQSASASGSANKSFRVDNESSPYAFEPEPLEIRPSAPYRRKQPDMTKQIHEPQKRENKPKIEASASAMTQTSSNTTSTEISSKKAN